MAAILEKGPISRAGLSRDTGLSKQTTSEIVKLLEDAGWIEETGLSKGKVGRSAVLYQVVPDSAYIIGVDLGGTKLTLALADMTGALVDEETVATSTQGGQQVVRQIAELARKVAGRAGASWQKVRLAVIGMPGVVDLATGFVEFAPNIPGVDQLPVQQELCSQLGIDVVIENDVNLAVIGERWRGAGQGVDDLVFIALGTGIGQGIMLGGNLVRGSSGAAGEIGYLPLCSDPFTEEAKAVGAFESAVGSKAILRLYRDSGGECDSVRQMFDRAEEGDPRAVGVLDEIATRLALGVAATAALLNPSKVILGGSVGGRLELLERVRRILPKCISRPPAVEASTLGRRAAVVGALALGLEELHQLTHGSGITLAGPVQASPTRVSAGSAR